MEHIRDDMVFEPYKTMGGYIAKIKIGDGQITVRYGGHGLSTSIDANHPYEVRLLDGYVDVMSADEIYAYIKTNTP